MARLPLVKKVGQAIRFSIRYGGEAEIPLVSDKNCGEAAGSRGSQALPGVFHDKAFFGGKTQKVRRFQKDVGEGFVFHSLSAHYRRGWSSTSLKNLGNKFRVGVRSDDAWFSVKNPFQKSRGFREEGNSSGSAEFSVQFFLRSFESPLLRFAESHLRKVLFRLAHEGPSIPVLLFGYWFGRLEHVIPGVSVKGFAVGKYAVEVEYHRPATAPQTRK
jgi:hypothetical protein